MNPIEITTDGGGLQVTFDLLRFSLSVLAFAAAYAVWKWTNHKWPNP